MEKITILRLSSIILYLDSISTLQNGLLLAYAWRTKSDIVIQNDSLVYVDFKLKGT